MTRAATVSANPHNLARQLKGGVKEGVGIFQCFCPPLLPNTARLLCPTPPRPIILG